MVKKKNKRIRRQIRSGPIFVSPDGGETVYEQKNNGGWGRMIHQSETAKLVEQASEEINMMGVEAIKLRRQHPALQKAWEQYKMLWNIITKEDESN
jgi:hypothetical protein